MKQRMNDLINSANKTALRLFTHCRGKLAETRGDFVMDHAVVFIIIIVVAALVISLLVAYLNNDFSDLLRDKISTLFN
jgi:hypothetical protein